jgi:hypothetical protein
MGLGTLLSLAGATIGGWIGWLLGSSVSFFVAFLLSVVGTGVGMYYGRVLARRWS